MTYQEIIFKDKEVMITSMVSKSGKVHKFIKRYVGRIGRVLGDSHGGQLLIQFGRVSNKARHTRAIPAGCVTLIDTIKFA